MNNGSESIVDYYELLGVEPEADVRRIRHAYLESVKQWHPDRNPHRTAEAEQMTKALNQAWAILGDPARRKQYDRMLRFTRGRDFRRTVNDRRFWKTLSRASPTLKRAMESVLELYALFKDAAAGRYKVHKSTLGIIGGGLLYFVMPADFIPDILPLVGFADDLAVLTAVINSLHSEIAKYRSWKKDADGRDPA